MKKAFGFVLCFLVFTICFAAPNQAYAKAGGDGLIPDSEKESSGVYNGGKYGEGDSYSTTIDISSDEEEEPSWFVGLLIDLLVALGDGFNSLLEKGGMTIDNIIFGRVDGHGVRLKDGEDSVITSFFTFELAGGNVYGVVAAMLYQKIRSFMYVFLFLFCFIKLFMIGIRNDYEKLRMDFSSFVQSSILAMALMVFMPYAFDLYIFIRDMLLKVIVNGSIRELLNGTSDIVDSYRSMASGSMVGAILYLGAVSVSVMFAAIYVTYAMSMLIHFILFPAVCVKSISNRKVLSEWTLSTVGLTVMPIIDGVLLILPLAFNSLGLCLLSLIAAGALLSARSQARETLGIRNNGMDTKAMLSIIGMAQMARGIGQGVKNATGRVTGGLKSAKSDKDMADYYEEQAGKGSEGTNSSETDMEMAQPLKNPNSTAYHPDPIAEKHANVDNFESYAFAGKLSDENMAQLYKQRAKKTLFKSGMGALGSVGGGIAGGLVGFSAASFMGTGMRELATGLGISAGSELGGFAGDLAGTYGYGIMNTGRHIPKAVYSEDTKSVEEANDDITALSISSGSEVGMHTSGADYGIGAEYSEETVEYTRARHVGIHGGNYAIPEMKESDQDVRTKQDLSEEYQFGSFDREFMTKTEVGKSILCNMRVSCMDANENMASIGMPQYEASFQEYNLKKASGSSAEELQQFKNESIEKLRGSICSHIAENVTNRCAADPNIKLEQNTPEVQDCIRKAAVNASALFYNSDKCSNVNLASHGFTFDWD